MKVGIVGLGLIGGSLALDLKASGFAKKVVGVDSDPGNAAKALELGLVKEIRPYREAAAASDMLILAIPSGAIAGAVRGALDLAAPGSTVTDMGSTKRGICAAAAGHPRRKQFVASHPMAGTEDSGPCAALRGLFAGKVAVICEAEKSGTAHVARVSDMYSALGMRLIRMKPGEHDLHAAYVSHLSHISSFVLANTVLAKETDETAIFDLAGGGFESTVRLAKSSPETWASIFLQNRANVLRAVEDYIEHLCDFHRAIRNGSAPEIKALMANANRIRPVLGAMRSGGKRRAAGGKKAERGRKDR